jgi:hypothetical protein
LQPDETEMISEERFLDFIGWICKRPKLYTRSGSFIEAIMFLEGYALGAGVEGAENYHSKFTPFKKWAAAKFRNGDTFPLNWDEFLDHFSSESEALNQLPILYAEYARGKESA